MSYGDHYALKTASRLGLRSKLLLNRRLYERIARVAASSPRRVLEIGPGHGFFAKACAEAGDSFFGVEPHVEMSRSLRERGFTVDPGKCPPIPHPAEKFDVVYLAYVLEYLKDAATVFDLIGECKRVLRAGGTLAVVSSDYPRMKREFWEVSYMTSFATSERRVRQLFFDHGLSHRASHFFAGNLFGPTRYLAYVFYKLYGYRLWSVVFGKADQLDSRFYKLRLTFPEGFLSLAQKDVAPARPGAGEILRPEE